MMRRRFPRWLGPLAILALASLSARGLHAASPDGPASGRLELAMAVHDGVAPESIDAGRSHWRRTSATDGPPLVVPTNDIVRWGACPPWPTGHSVLLAGGGVLAGRVITRDDRTIVVETATFGRLTLSTDAVRGWRLGPAVGPGPLAARRGYQGYQGLTDPPEDGVISLLLANGDLVTTRRLLCRDGSLTIDPPAGRVGSAAAAPLTIPAAVVQAVDVASREPARAGADGPNILVAFADGSRFAIASLEPADAAATRVRLAVVLPGAAVAAECDADDLLAVAVDGGRSFLLAVRAADACEQRSTLGPSWPLARGHTLTGDWPALRGTTAFSALGIHATATVRYRLPTPVTRFQSLVAIDDSSGDGGSVVVRVLAGAPGHPGQEVFTSGTLRGGEPPVRIDVPLPAATAELQLVVESADHGDILDRTLWLDPLVMRAAE